MLFAQEIFDKSLSILPADQIPNKPLLEEMAFSAAAELESRLRSSVTPNQISDLFVRASAFLTVSNYLQFSNTDDLASVRVGNVSVSRRGASSTRSNASSLRKQAELLLAPYIDDPGFRFEGVRG